MTEDDDAEPLTGHDKRWDPFFFHKYYLHIASPDSPIEFLSVNFERWKESVRHVLHIHCFDAANLHLFHDMMREYAPLYNIVVTYSRGDLTDEEAACLGVCSLRVKNKGADIGGKICLLHYLYTHNLDFDHVFFVHSKSDQQDFAAFLKPFQKRAQLVDMLFRASNGSLGAIFPDVHNIVYNEERNHGSVSKLDKYYMTDLLNYYGIPFTVPSPDKMNFFNGTNFLILHRRVIDFIFLGRTTTLYHALNENNSYDFLWHKILYQMPSDDVRANFATYQEEDHVGNPWEIQHPLRNGAVEHTFERVWSIILDYMGESFLCLPPTTLTEFFHIRWNAVYFPQFHNSEENNRFWGEGFTEWTLLAPYHSCVRLRGTDIRIMKPHPSIGYYSLDDDTFTYNRQKQMLRQYSLHGFVVYHYWFGNNYRVLRKMEDLILADDANDLPFCFSWANEPWTRNWDGSEEGVLIDQTYEEEGNEDHIRYLIQFFKKPNYMRDEHGSCIFYIYSLRHIHPFLERILQTWLPVLRAEKLTVKLIFNKNPDNFTDFVPQRQFLFLPLALTDAWETHFETDVIVDGATIDHIGFHYEIDYNHLIEVYKTTPVPRNMHLGLPLFWNNIIRKKRKPHLHTRNFSKENLRTMVLLTLSKIALRYTNKITPACIPKYSVRNDHLPQSPLLEWDFDDNVVNINAWNEWNEQAILEPDDVTGYTNLETLHEMISTV